MTPVTEMRVSINDQQLSVLLRQAGISAPIRDRDKFLASVNEATQAFIGSRYFESMSSTPSAQLKQIRSIDRAARKLLMSFNPGLSRVGKETWRELGRSSSPTHRKDLQTLFNSVNAPLDGLKRIRRSIELLSELTEQTRSRLEPRVKSSKVRHEADKAMKILFGDLTYVWLEGFGEFPSIGTADRPGSFVQFVLALFTMTAKNISASKEKTIVAIAAELTAMKAGAIRERYRHSGVAKVRAGVKSESK